MNNFTFGDEGMGYYETIAGGAGAGPSWHGRSGVHTHMTNTRITGDFRGCVSGLWCYTRGRMARAGGNLCAAADPTSIPFGAAVAVGAAVAGPGT